MPEAAHSAAFHLVSWLILRRPDGHVLLGRRSDDASYGAGFWGLPGGHVKDTETLAQAAARETLEEVGLTVEARTLRPLGMARYVDGEVRGADFSSWRPAGRANRPRSRSAVRWPGSAHRPCRTTPCPGWRRPWRISSAGERG